MTGAVWEAALEELRSYSNRGAGKDGRPGSEALVYLGGVVVDGELLATTAYLLTHEAQGDAVVVGAAEARWLLRTLRCREEKLIAQIHTHRGRAGHSPGDDLHATSFHEGFLSIVVPFFGRDAGTPADCAVLEFRGGAFRELSAADIDRRIRLDVHVVRRPSSRSPTPSPSDRREHPWTRFAQRLSSIARRLR